MHQQDDAATASPDQMNHVSDAVPPAPRLSEALLTGPVGKHKAFMTTLEKSRPRWTLSAEGFDGQLKQILEHIEERLKIGVLEAWFAPQAYDYLRHVLVEADASADEIKESFESAKGRGSDEEKWARAFTEMAVFAMYGGHGLAHELTDKEIYEAFPRVYSISMACQYLSTYCVQSRGFDESEVTDPASKSVGLGCTASVVELPIFPAGKKATFKQSEAPRLAKLMEIPLAPGDVVIFNPGGPTTNLQNHGHTTHITSVLRTAPGRIQWIDTGVTLGDDQAASEGGTTDHRWNTTTLRAQSDMVAWGKIKPAPDLAGAAEKTAAARPLAFVRLLIVDIRDAAHPVLRFVSKLVHMRHHVSHLMWSLRGIPVQGVEAIWYVYLPRGAWAKNVMAESEPLDPPTELSDGVVNPTLYQSHVIYSKPGGGVSVLRRRDRIWKRDLGAGDVSSDTAMREGLELLLPSASPTQPLTYKVGLWASGGGFQVRQTAFTQQYLRRVGEAVGAASAEAETGVAFFDP